MQLHYLKVYLHARPATGAAAFAAGRDRVPAHALAAAPGLSPSLACAAPQTPGLSPSSRSRSPSPSLPLVRILFTDPQHAQWTLHKIEKNFQWDLCRVKKHCLEVQYFWK